MNAKTNKKRKYFEGYVNFDENGSMYEYTPAYFNIFADEFVSYDGDKKLIIKRNNNIYDLSEYDFEKPVFYPQPKKVYDWQKNIDKYLIADIIGGLKKKNFVFTDKLIYKNAYSNGCRFESLVTGRKYYVTSRHFDEYFVSRMVNGIITDTFTFAKHGSVTWLTVVT